MAGYSHEVVATREFKPSLQAVMQAVALDSRLQSNAWFRRAMLILALACIGWIAFTFLSTGNLRMLEGVAVGLFAALVVWFILFWVIPRLVESLPHNKSAFTPRRYTFDADALSLQTVDGVALRAPYRTFSKISMGTNYILFYENFPGLAAHVIPAEAFESKAHENAVRGWLAAYAAGIC